jgi:hypothetical protein
MNRLFIKVKTAPKIQGTLMEVQGKITIEDTIEHIVQSMDGLPKNDETGTLYEYHLIRMGSPKRILPKGETFTQAGMKNGDSVLITTNPDMILKQDLFDFIPLSIKTQEISVQDLRAPLRLPPAQITVGEKTTVQLFSDANESVVTTERIHEENEEKTTSFGFQALDIDFLNNEKESDESES